MSRMIWGPGMEQERVCFYQCRSSRVLQGGECGMKGLLPKMAMNFSRLVRYARSVGTTVQAWRSLPYSFWTSLRLCVFLDSHVKIAWRYLVFLGSRIETVWLSRFQRKPMKGASVPNGMSLSCSQGMPSSSKKSLMSARV